MYLCWLECLLECWGRYVKQANFAIAVPYPGTEFHEIAKRGD